MNTQRLISMGLRLLMRFGSRWMRNRAGSPPPVPDGDGNDGDRRAFRGKQPQGVDAKKLRAIRRMGRF